MKSRRRWVSQKKWDATSARRRQSSNYKSRNNFYADQRGQEGRDLEERVLAILTEKKEAGEIEDVVRHDPHSIEDLEGKDFTVILPKSSPVSFGITCSFNSYKKYFQNHPGQECIWISSHNNEEIWQMIRDLCLRSIVR